LREAKKNSTTIFNDPKLYPEKAIYLKNENKIKKKYLCFSILDFSRIKALIKKIIAVKTNQ
jgi:hypothetical protein